jgi:hypothetical protein
LIHVAAGESGVDVFVVGVVDVDLSAEEAEVFLEGVFAGDHGGIGELGDGDGGEDAEDDDDDEYFDEAEAGAQAWF